MVLAALFLETSLCLLPPLPAPLCCVPLYDSPPVAGGGLQPGFGVDATHDQAFAVQGTDCILLLLCFLSLLLIVFFAFAPLAPKKAKQAVW